MVSSFLGEDRRFPVEEEGMEEKKRRLRLLPDAYAVCSMEKNAPVPDWGTRGLFSSVTRTEDELSVVCPEAQVPGGVKKESGWKVLMVEGPLDFSLTGVLASLTAPLAREGISVFALSTYGTDYLLVKEEKLEKAIQALRGEGYEVMKGRRAQGARCRGKKRG
jgi:hypothetical protein